MTVIMKVDLVGPKSRGLAVGLNEFAGYLAVGVTAFLTGYLASRYGLRPVPIYLGIGYAVFGKNRRITLSISVWKLIICSGQYIEDLLQPTIACADARQLTGDFGGAFEAASTDDCSLFCHRSIVQSYPPFPEDGRNPRRSPRAQTISVCSSRAKPGYRTAFIHSKQRRNLALAYGHCPQRDG